MARRSAYKVKILGTAEVIGRFRAMGYKTEDLHAVFGRIAAEVAQDARAYAPKVSGRLAGDIRPLASRMRAGVNVGRASSVPYAGPINYGWRKRNIEPSMFMQKAADPKAESSADDIAAEINRIIRNGGLG